MESAKEQRKATLKDVAARVGVSKMAVSVVLGGDRSSHVRVSDRTRARILEVAHEMGYRPHAVARSLRRRSTNIIGLYCGYGYLNARLPFLAEIIGGLQEACDQHQKDLLLHGVFRGQSVESIYQELANGSIDGLVIHAPPNDPLVDRLAESPLPVVAIGDAIPALPSVVVDDIGGSYLIADYLIAKGHRHILYRNSPPRLSLAAVQRRRTAFVEAVEADGLEVIDWTGEEQTDAHDPTLFPCLDRARDERPTVAVCWNDRAAYDMLAHCLARRLPVPEDFAIIGFDGIGTPLDRIWKLTTVRAPWAQVAQTAIKLLVAQIAGEPIAQETVLPVELVCGNTA